MRKIGLGAGLTAAALMALTGCAEQKKAPPLPPLDALLAFKDAARCQPAPDLQRLTTSVVKFEGSPMELTVLPAAPQVPEAYRSQVGEPDVELNGDTYRATVPLSGTWRGLKVRQIAVGGWMGYGNRLWIGFDAPFEDVLREVNAAGFRLGQQGRRVDSSGPPGVKVTIAVERDQAEGAVLSCSIG